MLKVSFNEKIPMHSIVRIPCPHCSHLCSAKAKSCPKCGEPLTPLEHTASKEENLVLIEERSNEIMYIKLLEAKIGKRIPHVKKVKKGSMGFVMDSGLVIGLSLYNCGLVTIPQEIFDLNSLRSLYLRRNNIKMVSNLIGFLNTLEELILSINEIEALPSSIGLLSGLRMLMLDSNKLKKLPETMGSLKNLEKLHLTNNQLRELPECLTGLSKLESLDIRGNLLLKMPETIIEPKKYCIKKTKQASLDKFLK